jgi:undecaprenyl-diphosphatase
VVARFLQKRGIDTATAVGSVTVDRLAGAVVHLALTGAFIAFAGTSGLRSFQLPSLLTIGLIVLGIVTVAVVGAMLPWSRTRLRNQVLPATRRSLAGVSDLLHQPNKMVELFGGALVITMGYVLALAASVYALGVTIDFTSIALVFLVGSIVANLAPTPGGIGAVEAVLIAGLTSAGMPSSTAAASVLLFRVVTFWLPLFPGWAAFIGLQRAGDL